MARGATKHAKQVDPSQTILKGMMLTWFQLSCVLSKITDLNRTKRGIVEGKIVTLSRLTEKITRQAPSWIATMRARLQIGRQGMSIWTPSEKRRSPMQRPLCQMISRQKLIGSSNSNVFKLRLRNLRLKTRLKPQISRWKLMLVKETLKLVK